MAKLPVREMPAMWKCGQEAAALQASTDCPADARQVGGTHYRDMPVQPWDVMAAWMSKEQFNGFLLCSALAYIARVNTKGVDGKGGRTDIAKAAHYLEKWLQENPDA